MPNRRERRMVGMNVIETSGVDHPAHGYEGWLVRKSASSQQIARLNGLVRKDDRMPVPKPSIEGLTEEVRKSKLSKAAQDSLIKAFDLTDDINTAAELWQSLRSKQEADDPSIPSTTDAAAAPSNAPPANPAGVPLVPGMPLAAAAGPAMNATADLFKSVTDPADRAMLMKMVTDNAALKVTADTALLKAAAEEGKRLDAEAIEVSKSAYSHLAIDHTMVAPAMRKMALADPEGYAVIKAAYDQAEGQLDAAGMFDEIGTRQSANGGGNALGKATKLAEGYLAAGVSTDMTSAMAKAWTDNPSLYNEYEKENN
jgi:hypothetical protein